MPKIGLKKAYYATIVEESDIPGSITYNTPVALENVQQVQVNPRVSRVQVSADDLIVEDISECLGADLTIQRTEFTPEEEAILLGRPTDGNGGVYGGTFDNPPYVAFGYMRTFKDTNVGLYVWVFKAKFAPSQSTADTKPAGNITPQYDSMTASSITRTADGAWVYSAKSSDPAFADTFFTKTMLETLVNIVAPAAIALSSILPADGATDASKTGSIVLTFNNKIAREAVSLISAAGDIVAVTKSFDAAGKVLTITPSAALASTTKYIVSIAGVTDIYGQALAATAKDFTTVV